MASPGPNNTSDTARLMVDPPGFAIGWQTPVYLPDPAAGAQWSYTVDGRYYERIVAVSVKLVTSAVAANRFPLLTFADANGTAVTAVPLGSAVAASSTINSYLTAGAPGFDLGPAGGQFGYIPDLLLPPGWSLRSSVAGMDAADQFSGVVLLVQRFPNDATSITAGE